MGFGDWASGDVGVEVGDGGRGWACWALASLLIGAKAQRPRTKIQELFVIFHENLLDHQTSFTSEQRRRRRSVDPSIINLILT